MSLTTNLLPGLPPYGAPAKAFPAEWAASGKEGVVVRFDNGEGTWVGNFCRGLGGVTFSALHPNGRDALVAAEGDLWSADVSRQLATVVLPCVVDALEVLDPSGWVFNRQGLALARLGPDGILWHSRRLSWDGIADLRMDDRKVTGRAWKPNDTWHQFEVDLQTGKSVGGSFGSDDVEQWEKLATDVQR
jgi:hypothetical protein